MLCTVHETASFLRISEQQVYKLLNSGQIDGFKMGSVWRVKRSWIAQQLEGTTSSPGTFVIDADIRDKEPRVEIEPCPFKSHLDIGVGMDTGEYMLFKITDDVPGWWDLDDLAHAVLGADYYVLSCFDNWLWIEKKNAPRLVAAFDAVGKLKRVRFARSTFDEKPEDVA